MADINLGDVRASLRIDTGDFARSMEEANRRLEGLSQQLRQMQQAQQQTGQSSAQVAQALRELAQATSQGTQAYTETARRALEYRQEQDRLRESLRQTREEQGRATDGWRQFLQVAGGLGIATGIGALVSQMTNFAKSVVEVGVSMQNLRTTLGAIAGDASAGARQFEFLFNVGQRLGVSITSLADGYRSLSAATRGTVLQGVETQKIFEGVTIAGRAFGATSAQIGQGLLALEQMISKGTVSMEELRRQLGNAIPGAFGLAAKAIGVTTEELNKLVESGELRSIPFVRAFARYLTEELKPAAEQATNTAGAAFAQLGNQIVALKDAIAASGLLDFLRDAAKATTALLKVFTDFHQAQAQLREAQQGEALINTGLRQRDLTPEQLERLTQIRRERANGPRPATMTDILTGGLSGLESQVGREVTSRIEADRKEEEQILATARAAKARREEQERLNAEERKGRNEREQDAASLETIRKKFDDITKLQVELGRQQRLIPEVVGREGGTVEEQRKFLALQQEQLTTGLQDLAKLIEARRRTAGPLPDIDQARLGSLREQLSGNVAALKALDDAEKAAAEAQRQRERDRQQAAQQREQAIRQEISLTTELGRLQVFLGSGGQSAAALAQSRVELQGADFERSARQALETIRKNPFIPRELAAQFEAGLVQLPEVVQQKAAEAFQKTDEQLRARTAGIGDQLSQLAERLSAAGLSPLDADLARITRTFDDMRRGLLALQATLQESRKEATEAGKEAIDAQLARVQAQLPLIDPARDAALREREVRPETEELTRLRNQLAQLRAQRNERMGVRAELQAADVFRDPGRRAEADALVNQIKAQERLNHYMSLFEQLGNSVGSAWTNALQSIAQGTQTVGAAFKAMAQSIMQSMAQIASQEAFKGFLRLAIGLIFGAGTQTLGGNTSMGGTSNPGFLSSLGVSGRDVGTGGTVGGMGSFAAGGVVNRPTFALLGENPATTPEYVLNRQSMQALMSASPSAGGQAMGGVTVINVPNMAMAQEEQARQRALGRDAIINVVLSEMAQGDRSQILRTVRLTGR